MGQNDTSGQGWASPAPGRDRRVALLRDSDRLRHERERALMQLTAAALFLLWLLTQWSISGPAGLAPAATAGGVYVLFVAASWFSLYTSPRSRWRLTASIVVDTMGVGAAIYFTGVPDSPFFLLFFQIAISALLRFGWRSLVVSLASSVAVYLTTVAFYMAVGSPDGPLSMGVETGKMMGLVGIPLYFAYLTGRIEKKRQGYAAVLEGIERYTPGVDILDVTVEEDDEAKALAMHLALLTRKIKGQHDELIRRAETLERTVEERTAQLTEQMRRAQAGDRMKTQFLNNLSHELRTPLHSIVGFSDILAGGVDDREKGRKMAGMIRKNALSLLKRIEDLTDLTRLMAGEIEPEPSPVNMREVIVTAVDSVADRAHDRGVVIETEIAEGLGGMLIDGSLTYKILVELLDNAVKFSPADGTVVARCSHGNDLLRIAVSDRGQGIDDEQKGRLFGLFSQGEGDLNRRYEGLGVGLAIVRSLAEAMGGSVEVADGDEGGSIFSVSLPARRLGGEGTGRSAVTAPAS
jgi:signal transduction histidine kinase